MRESIADILLRVTRERDAAHSEIKRLRANQALLDDMRARWNELVAERDKAIAALAVAAKFMRHFDREIRQIEGYEHYRDDFEEDVNRWLDEHGKEKP